MGASDVEAVLRACTSLAWLGLAQLPVPEGALVAALRAGVLRTLVVPGARTVYETQVALSPNSASAAAVAAARAAMDAPANADAALEVLRDASGALQVPPLDVLYVSPAHSTFRDALLSRGSIPAHECVEFSVWDAVFDDNADVLEEAGARARLVFNNVPRERYGAHESAAKRNAVMDLGDAAMVASFEGRGAVLAALLVHGAPCDTIVCGEQAIHAACRGPRERDAQRAHCVKLLLAAGVNVNARTAKVSGFFTPLMLAAWKESDAVLRVLLDNKADVDSLSSENRKSALDFAARYDCEACVRMLCAAGAAVNGVRGQNAESPLPLELAAWKGKRGTVSALLDAGAKTVVSGRPSEQTVLHIGACARCGCAMRVCASAHSRSRSRRRAALRLNPDVASLLICPETVNVPMAEGVTPLHLAVHARSESLVRQLLSAGANCYALTTKHGAAPIHMAVRMHEVGIVRLFLAHDRGLLQAATATGESTLALVARITDPAVSAYVCGDARV